MMYTTEEKAGEITNFGANIQLTQVRQNHLKTSQTKTLANLIGN